MAVGRGALVGGGVALGSVPLCGIGVGGLGMDAEVGTGTTLVGSGVACLNPSHPNKNNVISSKTAIKRIRRTHM